MRLRTLHGAVTMRRVCPAWAAGIAAGLKQLTLSEDELHRLACFPNLTHLTVERARVQPQRPQQQAPAGVAPAAQQPPPLPLAQRLRLPRLCHLSLQCCERLQGELAADTPATVQLLSGLTALELASNTPGALPAWALQLPQLQALHVLGWRPLTSGLPDGLWALHQLRSLRIQPAGGYSLAMPDGLSNLTALTRLDLSSGHAAPAGGLSALPEGLGALAELQVCACVEWAVVRDRAHALALWLLGWQLQLNAGGCAPGCTRKPSLRAERTLLIPTHCRPHSPPTPPPTL